MVYDVAFLKKKGKDLKRLTCGHDGLFESADQLAGEIEKKVVGRKRSSLKTTLSEIFNGKALLTEDVEIAIRQAVVDSVPNWPGKDLRSKFLAIEECIYYLSRARIMDSPNDLDALIMALRWSDTYHLFTNRFDPIVHDWKCHPIDGLIHDLFVVPSRRGFDRLGFPILPSCAPSSGSHPVERVPRRFIPPTFYLYFPSADDAAIWFGRNIALHIARSAELDDDKNFWLTGDWDEDPLDEYKRNVSYISSNVLSLMRKLEKDGRFGIRTASLESCRLPTIVTDRGGCRSAFVYSEVNGSVRTAEINGDLTRALTTAPALQVPANVVSLEFITQAMLRYAALVFWKEFSAQSFLTKRGGERKLKDFIETQKGRSPEETARVFNRAQAISQANARKRLEHSESTGATKDRW